MRHQFSQISQKKSVKLKFDFLHSKKFKLLTNKINATRDDREIYNNMRHQFFKLAK